MHRTPNLKAQATLLREMQAALGFKLTQAQALETVARMNGYASWNTARAAERAGHASGSGKAKVCPPLKAAPQTPPDVYPVFEVNMADEFEYETPDEVAEWRWIAQASRFSHVGNGVEPGVWEYLVRCDETFLEHHEVPERLKPFYEKARAAGAVWILFHQG